jgi:hypothetical protein
MKILFLLPALMLPRLLAAQGDVVIGSRNSVIRGANNKISYISSLELKNNIPDSLTNYIAGLLFTNKNIKSDQSSILSAVTVWMNKYHELENKIASEPDLAKRNKIFYLLREGDFAGVEDELHVKTDFKQLSAKFPDTYMVYGDRNSIINGDFNTVTYVVKQIINYNLPEGLTANLITELKMSEDTVKTKNRQVTKLLHSLQSKDNVIQSWVVRYRSVEKELKNSPTAVSKKAYGYFIRGYLDSAMLALSMANTTVQALADNSILKAKILLLELNYKSYDSTLNEINKAYSIGVNISPTYNRLIEYGQFLINYPNDVNIAISVLTKALDSATTSIKKITVYKLLGIAYQSSDKVRSTEMLEKALAMLTANEPLTDSSLLDTKAIVQFGLGYNYGNAGTDTAIYRSAVDITWDAIGTLARIKPSSENLQFKKAIFESALGGYYTLLQDTGNALKVLNEALAFFADEHNDKLSYVPAAVNVYVNLAQVHMNNVQLKPAIECLYKAKELIRQKVNIKSNIYLIRTEQVYTMLVNNYGFLQKRDSVIKYLDEFRMMLEPLTRDSSKVYLFSYSQVITDLAAFYIDDGRLEQGEKLLQMAYTFFSSNLISVEADNLKFEKCMNFMAVYYIKSQKQDSGITFFKTIVAPIKKNENFNKLTFEDFESQIYLHISELFADKKGWDSAKVYVIKAIEISETKAKQGPLINIIAYTFHVNKYCTLLQRQGLVEEIDSLSKSFISSCQFMSGFSPYIKDHYRGVIGNCAASFGSNICDVIDSLNLKDTSLLLSYYAIADMCYEEALRNQLVANLEKNNEYNFAYFLYSRARLETKWACLGETTQRERHLANKARFLKQCDTYMNILPPAPPLDDLRQKVATLK